MVRTRGFTALRFVLGAVLLAAAALKLYGRNLAPFAQYGFLTAPAVQSAAVGWELVLGLWLWSGRHPRAAWAAARVTFAGFAGVSFYLGWVGQASCGCLGAVKANPWVVFALDVAAVIALAVCRPALAIVPASSTAGFRFADALLGGAGLLAVTVGVGGTLAYGSPDAALARLRGEPLTLHPGYADFGDGAPGDTLLTQVEVRNWTAQPVRLIGGTADCSCVATDDLPLTVPPGGGLAVTIRLKVPSAASGEVARKAVLWTGHEQARRLTVRLGYRVR
jgi:hypothetical protein